MFAADLPVPDGGVDAVPSICSGTYTRSGGESFGAYPPPMLHQDSFVSKMADAERDLIGPATLTGAAAPTALAPTASVKKRKSLWSVPEGGVLRTIWWAYTWPIKCVLTVCIPNPKTWRRLYPVTFVMCVLFIGLNSYMIVWMITVMGE